MNKEKYINVYYTISPQKMYAYSKWVAKLCFGVKPDSNQYYSFIRNSINGHFSFSINPKYFQPRSTPQTENEAKALLNKLIYELKTKLTSNSEPNFPNDFPSLFNNNQIKLKGISPNYNSNGNFIVSWSALYGFEFQTFSQQDDDEFQNNNGALEGDSVIIEICGSRIVTLYHNHSPVIQQKGVAIFPDNNSEFIYKKVNQTTIAPYYLTSNGYVPACKDSVPILKNPVSFGWSNSLQKTPENSDHKSMITMSDIVHPKDGNPGSAKIVIAMDYRVITIGEGAVDNIAIIDPKEFSMLYNIGNAPGTKYKSSLKLKSLPSVSTEATTLLAKEFRQSKRKDKATGKLVFNDFYNVKIDYQFIVDTSIGLSLWEGIKWLKECSYSRGLIYLLPFQEAAEKWYGSHYNQTLYDIKNELSQEEKADCTEDDFKQMLRLNKYEATLRVKAESHIFILKNIISENEEKYSNCNLFIDSKSGGGFIENNHLIFSDSEFEAYLSTIGSTLYNQIFDDNSKPWKNIEEFFDYFMIGEDLLDFALDHIHSFKKKEQGNPAAGAAGKIGHPNLVILNPDLYGKSSLGKKFNFGGMTPTEILVHEAGHNAAEDFFHRYTAKQLTDGATGGTYEYNQEGLQSNQHNLVFPTLYDNTIRIVNDKQNRENMTIL